MLLHAISSRSSSSQWTSWNFVRLLASHVVVSAEAAKAVSQHGHGLIQLPGDMLQTLEGYFQDSGLSGKVSKQQALALTEKLKALSRSTAAGGLQAYRDNAAAGGRGSRAGGQTVQQRQQPFNQDAAMTAEQLQEQREMDREREQLAAALGPEELARYRATRAAAAAAAKIPLARTKGGRVKTSTIAALEDHISQYGVLGLPHEAVRAVYGLPPSSSLMGEARGEAIKAVTPKYNQTQALAYAMARLPSCFAASHRIFKELAVRFPGFEPKTLLDFGAGPGTAIWAAQEVWPSSLSRVTAVEPSVAMSQLGRRLEAARRFAHPHAPLVRWRPDMPPDARRTRKKAQQQTYNIVVASYVLGELPTPHEREALVRQLWSVTGDMLVLIEPGTPAGFSNILEARSGILGYEGRRAEKLQKRLAAATLGAAATSADDALDVLSDSASSGSSGSSSGSSSLYGAVAAKARGKWFGAHVVAPCPHDAPCPLAVPGSRSWCHFGTRFQRPGFMQQAKAPAGSRMNPADHQDERYSYVVLRRGTRPAEVPQVDIRRSFAPREAANPAGGYAAGWQEQRMRTELFPAAAAAVSDTAPAVAAATSSSSGALASGQEQQQALQAGSQLGAAAAATASTGPVFNASELQELLSILPGSPSQQQQQQVQEPEQQQAAAAEDRYKKLGPYGPGLINRLIALEDAGVDWSASSSDGLTHQQLDDVPSPQLATDLGSGGSSSSSSSKEVPTTAAGSLGGVAGLLVSASGSETDDESSSEQSGPEVPPLQAVAASADEMSSSSDTDKEEEEEEEWEEEEEAEPAEGLLEAASSSATWSRIIRPPRKRGGHIILDVCTRSCGGSDSGGQSEDTVIMRHVVARSDAHKWMGSAGYELAKSANWGDLWPAAYDANEKQQVVSVSSSSSSS